MCSGAYWSGRMGAEGKLSALLMAAAKAPRAGGNRLLNQTLCAGSQQVRQRIRRKSLWIGQLGDGICRHVAYPFLKRELRRVNNAMICRPSGAITNF